ncbi:MAG: cyclic nucleotide-binding domain-containing protein [Rhodospirillales bacterium]|nr:cyclic nucleotide-binding domain-containing protein [Rhodospirillales bacterium]
MKKTKQTFSDGDVIFREGDTSDTAYEIVSGTVEIGKQGGDGTVKLARLSAGEWFGEMGALDHSTRNATARAAGDVTVNAIARQDFLEGVRDQPDMAMSIMSKMAERLRTADSKLAGVAPNDSIAGVAPAQLAVAEESAEGDPAKSADTGFWDRLLGFKGVERPEKIKIQVAPLFGDDDGQATKRVIKALERRKGVKVRFFKKGLKVDPDAHPEDQAKAADAAARRVLADTDSDLLIWGEVPTPGLTMHLKFVSFAAWNQDPAGNFGPKAMLPLVADFDKNFADFLYAVSLAATVPKSEAKAATLARDLALALDNARAAFETPPGGMTRRERGAIHLCYANALATVASQGGEPALFGRAAKTYRECLAVIGENELTHDWASAQKNLGATLQSLAERDNNDDVLGEAADALRSALKVLNKDDDALEWAATQNRLGEVLFRLDFESGDTTMLKHALGAYQSALQVYTRAKTPMRWAEVMNNFAQVTQVLGEQLKNAEALEKAAQACRAALEIRTKAKAPLLWASTQNNLGSSLFLLGKLTKNETHLLGAAEAFGLASSLYQSRGMGKMASVAEKNLSHVNQLLAQSQPKGPPEMDWEKDE